MYADADNERSCMPSTSFLWFVTVLCVFSLVRGTSVDELDSDDSHLRVRLPGGTLQLSVMPVCSRVQTLTKSNL